MSAGGEEAGRAKLKGAWRTALKSELEAELEEAREEGKAAGSRQLRRVEERRHGHQAARARPPEKEKGTAPCLRVCWHGARYLVPTRLVELEVCGRYKTLASGSTAQRARARSTGHNEESTPNTTPHSAGSTVLCLAATNCVTWRPVHNARRVVHVCGEISLLARALGA